MEKKAIKCRDCNAPAETIEKENTPEQIRCTSCGATQNLEEALNQAAAYYGIRHVKEQFQNTIAKTLQGSKDLEYKLDKTSIPKPKFIFVDLSAEK